MIRIAMYEILFRLYTDLSERIQAVKLGAEAYKLKEPKAHANGWKLAKHFKHHLHPATMATKNKLDKHRKPLAVDFTQRILKI